MLTRKSTANARKAYTRERMRRWMKYRGKRGGTTTRATAPNAKSSARCDAESCATRRRGTGTHAAAAVRLAGGSAKRST